MAKEVQSNPDKPVETPAEETGQSNNTLTKIPLGQIMTSDSIPQARRRARFKDTEDNFKPEITELAESIKKSGLINPITVRERHWRVFEGTSGPGDKKARWHVAEDARDYKRYIGKNSQAEAEMWAQQNRFEIVAGERRFVAAGIAGLTEILSVVRELTDKQMLEIQLVENVQREDVNPVDEALWYKEMENKSKWSAEEISLRVGKTQVYVRNRLLMAGLVPEWLDDLEKGHLPISFALEICKLEPEKQTALYNSENIYSTKWENSKRVADKSKICSMHVLKQQIAQTLYVLKSATFDLKSAKLHPTGLKCIECQERSGIAGTLFADYTLDGTERCLNSVCFESKTQNYLIALFERRTVKMRKDNKFENDWKPPIATSRNLEFLRKVFPNEQVLETGYSNGSDAKEVSEYSLERCKGKEIALCLELGDDDFGKPIWICRPASGCDYHYSSGAGSKSSSKKETKAQEDARIEKEQREKKRRKQEIFDCGISEGFKIGSYQREQGVRFKVFAQAGQLFANQSKETLGGALSAQYEDFLDHLTRFYQLVYSYDETTGRFIESILKDWYKAKGEVPASRYMSDTELKRLRKYISTADAAIADETRGKWFSLGLYFLLMHGHKGKIYDTTWTDQSEVIEIAARFGINYKKLDAEYRLLKASKKFKGMAQAYLNAVDRGETPVRPIFYMTDLERVESEKGSVQPDNSSSGAKDESLTPSYFKNGDRVTLNDPDASEDDLPDETVYVLVDAVADGEGTVSIAPADNLQDVIEVNQDDLELAIEADEETDEALDEEEIEMPLPNK